MSTLTLPDEPPRPLDRSHLAVLIHDALRATATGLQTDAVTLTRWLVHRPDDRGFRAEEVEGPNYRGPQMWDAAGRHWKSEQTAALTDYLWTRGAWKKTLTRDDDESPTRESWERFAWGDLIHAPLLHLATRASARDLVQSPCFDVWGLRDEDLNLAALDVAAMVCGHPRRVRAICPTFGLRIDGDEEVLAEGIRLRTWSTQERCEFLTLHHDEYLSRDFSGWFSDVALEVAVDVHPLDDETAGATVAAAIDAVKWAVAATLNRGATFIESPTIIETAAGWRGLTLRRLGSLGRAYSWPILHLSADDARRAGTLLEALHRIRAITSKLDTAVWLYGRSCNATQSRDALLDAAVGLETLLVPNPGESRYRFTLHGLALLKDERAEALERELNEIYRGRSIAAHSGISHSFELAPRARTLLARLVETVLALYEAGSLDLPATKGDVAAAVERLIKERVRSA